MSLEGCSFATLPNEVVAEPVPLGLPRSGPQVESPQERPPGPDGELRSRTYFGEPWPSGVCDDAVQVPTPVGENCELCGEAVEAHHWGTWVGSITGGLAPMHRE